MAIECGELAEAADARTLAVSIGVTMQGMSHQARDGATRRELQAVAALAHSAWPWTDSLPNE